MPWSETGEKRRRRRLQFLRRSMRTCGLWTVVALGNTRILGRELNGRSRPMTPSN